jgi:hypothetical protein
VRGGRCYKNKSSGQGREKDAMRGNRRTERINWNGEWKGGNTKNMTRKES